MSDIESENIPTTPKLFGNSVTQVIVDEVAAEAVEEEPAETQTPVPTAESEGYVDEPAYAAGTEEGETLPDEPSDYSDEAYNEPLTDLEKVPALEDEAPASDEVEAERSEAVEPEVEQPEPEAVYPLDPDALAEATIAELKAQEEAIHQAIKDKEAAEKREAISQIVGVVKLYGISTEELVEALGGLKIKRKGVKAKVKYKDPVSGSTWSGRGKEPSWIRGKDRAGFLVA